MTPDDQAKEPLSRKLAPPTMSELEDILKIFTQVHVDAAFPGQHFHGVNTPQLQEAIQAYTDRAVTLGRIDELEQLEFIDWESYHEMKEIYDDGTNELIDMYVDSYVKDRITNLTISVRDGGEVSDE